jgi:catalase
LPGFDYVVAGAIKAGLTATSVIPMVVSSATGPVQSAAGGSLDAQFNFENSRSTHFDSIVFVGSGAADGSAEAAEYVKKLKIGRTIHAVREAYMHQKAVGATGNAVGWVRDTCLPGEFSGEKKGIQQENGVVLGYEAGTGVQFAAAFIEAVGKHRVWDREIDHIAA